MTAQAEREGAACAAPASPEEPPPGSPEHVRTLVALAAGLWLARGLWLASAYETRPLRSLRKDALDLLAAEAGGLPH